MFGVTASPNVPRVPVAFSTSLLVLARAGKAELTRPLPDPASSVLRRGAPASEAESDHLVVADVPLGVSLRATNPEPALVDAPVDLTFTAPA
eukprot:7009160-Alexandrium_andersonii.AAC.1